MGARFSPAVDNGKLFVTGTALAGVGLAQPQSILSMRTTSSPPTGCRSPPHPKQSVSTPTKALLKSRGEMTESLGDRMKAYEAAWEGGRLDVHLPIYARIDGRSFSRFTRGFARPFDRGMADAMVETMRSLIDSTHANLGYTQSDEISLLFYTDKEESDTFFNGRTQKLVSVLASLATAFFTQHVGAERAARAPHFDCRVCQLPSLTEAANMFLWRWKDAYKNSISMVAQQHFSTRQLHGKHGGDMIEMLSEKGLVFADVPDFFRFGTFGRRNLIRRELTDEELLKIPAQHRPDGPVLRHFIKAFVVPDLLTIENREQFLFG